jgi:exosortase/archaeosortase family protein
MNKREVFFLLLRYIILVIIAIPNLYLFYLVFTPLTVYPTFFLFSIIDSASYIVSGTTNVIFFKGYFANIIPACVAGAAYFLLLILNLTTPMSVKKRIWSIIFLLGAFLILNLLRIFVFALLLSKGYQYFDLAHTATWYFGSTALVVLIWFSNIFIFRIKSIPIYTDLMHIYKSIRSY